MTYTPPPTGECLFLEEDVRCILAPNPSPMTFHGTNTYILGRGEVCVIDPGPANPTHLDAILSALGSDERIFAVLCTHAHLDHTPLALDLSQKSSAPIYAFGGAFAGESAMMTALRNSGDLGGGEGIDHGFTPDITLTDGQCFEIGALKLKAIWTPGHLSNHLCFQEGDRVFTGDHVMDWATSMISPPDGDLAAFMTSLTKLKNDSYRVFYPGHGGPVHAPAARVQQLYDHRLNREAQIIQALTNAPSNANALAERIYTDLQPSLLPAATRNVFAHLLALLGQGKVEHLGALNPEVVFERR